MLAGCLPSFVAGSHGQTSLEQGFVSFSGQPLSALEQTLLSGLLSQLGGNLGAEVQINYPKGIERRLKKFFGPIGRVPVVQEWIGSVSSGLVANLLGFESSDLRSGYHGIDALMKDPTFNRFVVLEAKGGKSTLRGNQMSDQWIKSRLERLEKRNPTAADTPALRQARLSRAKMWAMVVSTNLFRGTNLAVKIQTYPGVESWGSPFK